MKAIRLAAIVALSAFALRAELVGTIRVDVQGTATNATAISGGALGTVGGIVGTSTVARAAQAVTVTGAQSNTIATAVQPAALAGYLPLTGGEMTGAIEFISGDKLARFQLTPTGAMEIAGRPDGGVPYILEFPTQAGTLLKTADSSSSLTGYPTGTPALVTNIVTNAVSVASAADRAYAAGLVAAIPGMTVDVQAFTNVGAAVWTRPAGAVCTDVYLWGGGGGGGGGGRGTAYGGGGAGAGGWSAVMSFRASDFGTNETVTVGAGGGGGSGRADDGVGSPGSDGTDTTFGTWLTAPGGRRGAGGTLSSGVGGIGSSTIPGDGAIAVGGVGGTSALTATGGAGGRTARAGGGGGGGGGNSGSARAGGDGGGAMSYISATGGGGAGGAAGAAGTAGAATASFGVAARFGGAGGGGGGGATAAATAGGVGGAGGFPAGGGGGGGSSQQGDSANGGGGASGAAIIVTYCYTNE